MIHKKLLQDKRVFVVVLISFILSLSMIFLQRPLIWLDEHTHYARSIQLAHGTFMIHGEPADSQIGGFINEGELTFVLSVLSSNSEFGFSLNWVSAFKDIQRSNDDVFYAVTNTITNHPIVYLPYIVVAWISMLFSISPVYEMYLMRLSGCLCFYAIYLLALEKSTKAKLPLSLFLLSPLTFLTFSSVTADAYLTSISTLYTVILFEITDKIITGQYIRRKDLVESVVVTILMSFCKMPSFLLIGLLLPVIFIAYKHNFVQFKIIKYVFVSSILIAAFITLVFFYLVKDTNAGAYWGRNVDTRSQLSYIIDHPFQTIKLFFYSIFSYTAIFNIQTGYVLNTSWNAPIFIHLFFYVGLFLSSKERNSGNFITSDISQKYNFFDFFVYLVTAAYIFMVFLMEYLKFSEIGSSSIDGVQPRYFMPTIILLLLTYVYHSPKFPKNNFLFCVILTSLPLPFFIISQLHLY